MYDQLLEEDPWVQGYGDKREAKGEAKATCQNIKLVVQARFPALEALVMDRLERQQNLDALQKMLVALSTVQDESKARRYLLALQDEQ